ncbi:MAG TPA: flavin reductase [bacterium]|nr:flavin reductase [bacterium]
MARFHGIPLEQFETRIVSMIGNQWFLLTAGNARQFNTMTCSWGGMGYLWNRPVCFVFVRPQRHTYTFMESHAGFSMAFFDETHRDILTFCGSRSGRDVDKIHETGLSPVFNDSGYILYEQAVRVITCRKIYADDIRSGGFIASAERDAVYPEADFHKLYIGEIQEILERS